MIYKQLNFRNDRSFNLRIIIKPAVFAGKQKISGLYCYSSSKSFKSEALFIIESCVEKCSEMAKTCVEKCSEMAKSCVEKCSELLFLCVEKCIFAAVLCVEKCNCHGENSAKTACGMEE